MMDSNFLNSKKFKTLKNIVLTFQGKELLVYPYPIFISPRLEEDLLKSDEERDEVSFVYKGLPLHIYFLEFANSPMFLRAKWDKLEESTLFSKVKLEELEALGYFPEGFFDDPDILKLSVARYSSYFTPFMSALGISERSFFVYRLYCDMFDQSQQIMKNMEENREDFFEGIYDIVIDISEKPYCEEFKEARESLQQWASMSTPVFDIQEFYSEQRYKYGLQECKSILQTHLSETVSFGYSGVNENFFKKYDHRLQLALIFMYHDAFLYEFSTDLSGERYELLNRINLWNKQPEDGSLIIRHIYFIKNWYMGTLHKKLRLFFKA